MPLMSDAEVEICNARLSMLSLASAMHGFPD